MNDKRLELVGAPLHCCHDRGNLHEIWPRSDDVDYFKHEWKLSVVSLLSFVLCALYFELYLKSALLVYLDMQSTKYKAQRSKYKVQSRRSKLTTTDHLQ